MEKKLTRPRTGRKLAGVCAGISNYFGLDVSIVRIVYACATLFTAFAGGVLYLLLMIIIPEESNRNLNHD